MDVQTQRSQFVKAMVLNNADINDVKLVHGFIHMMENRYIFHYEIPLCIIEICFLFFYQFYKYIPFYCSCSTSMPKYTIQPTPFSLLSAIYGMKTLMESQIWSSIPLEVQCEYLKKSEINTDEGCEQIVTKLKEKYFLTCNVARNIKYLLLIHGHQSECLLHDVDITTWTADDIIVSFIHYFINYDDDKNNRHSKRIKREGSWTFIERLRAFLGDEKNPGQMMHDFYNEKTNYAQRTGGIGLIFMRKVCGRHNIKFGRFACIKKYIQGWYMDIMIKTYKSKGINIVSGMPDRIPCNIPSSTKGTF